MCSEPHRQPSHAPLRRAGAWIAWIVLAAIAAAGLRDYRVDNDLSGWVPARRSVGPVQTYLVVGGPTEALALDRIVPALRRLDSVAWCLDPASLTAAAAFTRVTPNDFVVSADGGWAGVFVFRAEGADDATLVRQVREVIERHAADPARIATGGPAVFHVALNDYSQRRLIAIMAGILILGGLMLRHLTGSLAAALRTQAAVVLSQVVLLGVISWRGAAMDMSLSMVPPLMTALGFSYAAHRLLRTGVTRILILCWLTTALGFGTFAFADLAPMRAFAVYAVVGLALVWLAVMTLLDPLPPTRRATARLPRWLRALRAAGWSLASRRPRAVVIVGVFVSVTGIVSVMGLTFETDPLRYFPADSEVYRGFTALDAHLTGMLPFQIQIDRDVDAIPMLQRTSGVRKVIDVTSFAKSPGKVYWCLADNDALPRLQRAEADWHAWSREHGASLQWRGVAAQLAEIGAIVRRTAMVALPFMAVVAGAAVALTTRRLGDGLISLWVNLIPVLAMIASAAATRWALGLPTIMIGAIATGVAVDDTLHVVVATRTRRSLRRSYVRCWHPCIASSLVAAVCLMAFAFSPFQPTAQFGVLLAMAIMAAAFADFLLLPALLRAFGVRHSASPAAAAPA